MHGLEELNWIKVLDENVELGKTKLSDKYRGIFTKEDAKSFSDHTDTMRKNGTIPDR